MIVKRIEPIAVSLPMRKPVIMAGEEVRQADNMLVRIEAADGTVGWGEAASAPTMTGETVASMVAAVRHLSPVLVGREVADIAGALTAMHGRMYGNHGAKAAIEIALHDLAGRASGRPVHALLGDQRRERVGLLAVIGGGDAEGDLRDAAVKKAQGFPAFKIKVGVDGAAADAIRTRAICAMLGAGTIISADANQGFATADAVAYAQAVAGCGLDFFEQPVRADDLDGMAAVAGAAAVAGIAIGADEGIHGPEDILRHHQAGAARGVSLKAIKLGGLRGVVGAAQLSDRLGMRVNISCKTGESSIAGAAALHVAAVIPGIAWALTLTHAGLGADVTARPISIAGGHADVPDRPGLGIDVDEDLVRRSRVEPPSLRVA